MKISFRRILSVLMAITVLTLTTIMTTADTSAAQFNLTDYSSDTPYSVKISKNIVTIQSAFGNKELFIDTPVIACSVYDKVFYFLSYTDYNEDYVACCYTYNLNNDYLTNITTLLPIFTDESRFSVDKFGRFYLIDRVDNYTINCFYEGNVVKTIKLDTTIYQLLCIDGTHVTAITAEGVYLVDEANIAYISDASPVTPCTYTGDGFITDSLGTIFTYNNGGIYPTVTETTIIPTDSVSPEITPKPTINDTYILTEQGTTVAKLRKSFGVSKDKFTVYKKDGSIYPQGKLGTGMTVHVQGKTYSVIIYGELTGEGNINSRDLKLMMKFLTDEETPDIVQSISADINCDGKICTKDLLQLSALY